MDTSTGAQSAARLLALGDLPPPWSFVERPEMAAVESWLRSRETRGALWVHGKPGSGRTTAVATAIRRYQSEGGPPGCKGELPTKRMQCYRGISLEEILDELSCFLSQMGNRSLENALDQRVHLCAKVAVLFQALKECPVLLWIDDLDALELSVKEASRDAESTEYFLEGCETLRGGASGVIIVSARRPPSEAFDVVEMGGLSPGLASEFWNQARGQASLRFEDLPPSWKTDAFTVILLARVTAHLEPRDIEALIKKSGSSTVDAAIEAALTRLSPHAGMIIEAASVLPPEPSRQALRDVATPEGLKLELNRPKEDPTLREIEDWGLLLLSPGDTWNGPPLEVLPRVRSYVEQRLRTCSPARWKELLAAAGSYYVKLGATSTNVWHLFLGWRSYFRAGLYEDAHEVQKVFLQEILRRGYVDLARQVLEETARTTSGLPRAVALGNLSIIYKNAGDYARALETYGDVRDEFLKLGDMANVARVLHQLGNTHYMRGEYVSALASYRQSIEISTELDDKAVAAATRIQIANSHYQQGNMKDALADYLGAIEETRALGDQSLTAAVALQLSQIHIQANRHLEAEACLEEAEACARGCGDLRNLIKVFQTEGMLAKKRREYDLARARYEDAARTAETLGDAIEAAASLVFAGDLERARLQPTEALKCYHRALASLESYGARGTATKHDLESLRKKIHEQVQSMAASLGKETFERILRRTLSGSRGSPAPR